MGGADSGARAIPYQLDDLAAQPHRLTQRGRIARRREPLRGVLSELDAVIRRDGLIVAGPGGADRVHPAAVEARQARIALTRLSAALRLPAGEEGDAQKDARRPQRRVGARGVYRIKGVAG